ncbi:MAG: MBL fold metallo-hydrolase [Phycisphaerae bacterium]|nr:MBL fold metallo-hydrolase [Phycisphaerae bacterium]MDW8261523.1 MBL fold metallo-hydrolase [Phycisphaerales bacterium]
MKLAFLGANRTVTGSSHLLQFGRKRILLDCGLFQGQRELARQVNQNLPDSPLDAVILSHGHLDHCGKLPVLVKSGYRGPIYLTPATADVARVVLLDSAEIQAEDADYLNRRALPGSTGPIRPLYTHADVHDVLKLFRRVGYGQRTDLGDGLGFTFFDAGHILGSAYVLMDWSEPGSDGRPAAHRSLLFTGDIGRPNTPVVRDPHPLTGPVDLLITESTYGARQHAKVDDIKPQLADAIQQITRQGGRLILPAFAVGRTQTLLFYYGQLIAEGVIQPLNLYIDSPMGIEISRITDQHRDIWDDETVALMTFAPVAAAARQVRFASSSQESRQINSDRGPCIIIASSPSCEFGRVLHHLKHSIERPQDMVLFTGWIPPETLGRRLQDGHRTVRIYDRRYEVRCQVRTLHGLSAHADGDELMQFLRPAIAAHTVAHVVHGEADQAEALAGKLLEAGAAAAHVPATGTTSHFPQDIHRPA